MAFTKALFHNCFFTQLLVICKSSSRFAKSAVHAGWAFTAHWYPQRDLNLTPRVQLKVHCHDRLFFLREITFSPPFLLCLLLSAPSVTLNYSGGKHQHLNLTAASQPVEWMRKLTTWKHVTHPSSTSPHYYYHYCYIKGKKRPAFLNVFIRGKAQSLESITSMKFLVMLGCIDSSWLYPTASPTTRCLDTMNRIDQWFSAFFSDVPPEPSSRNSINP